MNRFEYVNPRTVEQALAILAQSGESAVAKAGGIDLVDRMKDGSLAPARLVNLKATGSELRKLEVAHGARLGALVTLGELARHEGLSASFRAVAEAAGSAATPQVRTIATLGGNLCQRPRCWYYRNPDFVCLKKGGATCFAHKGENKYHAIFGGGPSYIVHPSTMATALSACGGSVRLARAGAKREVPLEKFFTLPADDYERENVLGPGELVVEVVLPPPAEGTQSAYEVAKERAVFDWPLAEVAAVVTVRAGIIERAQVVLGAAAPIPWRATAAEAALTGKRLTPEVARAAARAAVHGAKPLAANGYKVPLFEALVARAVSRAAGAKGA
jgi:xanthine dehydrogenase YagS FAD-binding subunit